eukprot:scaffold21654_cov63-Cyclotella_meneghiniana.AAC.3
MTSRFSLSLSSLIPRKLFGSADDSETNSIITSVQDHTSEQHIIMAVDMANAPPLPAYVPGQTQTSSAASSNENSYANVNATPMSRISEITNTQSEIERQRDEIEELKRQLELSKSARTIKAAGKKPVSNGQTSLHYGIVIPQLENYWTRDKFLPELWHKWFTISDPPKFCHVMTKGVIPPPGYEGLPEYYEKVLINMIITKWRALKSNATKAMRDWWKSKCIH